MLINIKEVVIRKMNPMDLEEVHAIFKDSIKSSWSIDELQKEFYNELALYLVATLNEKVIGFCGAWLVYDEAQITNTAVSKEYRNNKVAFKIFNELIKIVKEKDKDSIFLEVRESNNAALNFYKKLNFKEIGKRKKFYSDGETAILMSLEVK